MEPIFSVPNTTGLRADDLYEALMAVSAARVDREPERHVNRTLYELVTVVEWLAAKHPELLGEAIEHAEQRRRVLRAPALSERGERVLGDI